MPQAARNDSRSGVRRSVLPILVFAFGGCHGCRNDHPWVPYSIDGESAAKPTEDAAAVEELVGDASVFQEIRAEIAPAGATRWSLGGVDLVAPVGMVLELGAARDLDADGVTDAVAVVRSASDAMDPGAVIFQKGAAAPITLVPSRKGALGCAPSRRLSIVGPHSALVELGLGCPAQAAREPSRYLAVLSFKGAPRVQLEAGVLDPQGSPKLTLSADGSDRDADGIDDVTLLATLEGGEAPFEPGPRTSAKVRWFDRPAGLSRDPAEPDASLRAVASVLAARATRTKDAPEVAPAARQVRALYRALCAEGGSPRLVRPNGEALVSCGQSRGLEEAALAEVRAAVTNGDVLRAIGVLDRAQKNPATKTAQRTIDATNWITGAAPVVNATDAPRAVAAVPSFERSKAPAWGALFFESSGKLLVRTAAGVVRVDPATGDEIDAPDVKVWDLHVVSPSGEHRLLEVYNACDGVALHATLGPGSEQDIIDVPLPIAPPLGTARCSSAKGDPASALAIAWGTSGLEIVVAGEPLLVADRRASALFSPLSQPVTMGAPRSPDGKTLIVPTSLGLFVRGGKTRLLRAKELDGTYGEQRDCVISDDGLRVACIRAGRAWVATFPP